MFMIYIFLLFIQEFDFDVDTLYNTLFAQDSDLMTRVFEERKHQSKKITAFFFSLLYLNKNIKVRLPLLLKKKHLNVFCSLY